MTDNDYPRRHWLLVHRFSILHLILFVLGMVIGALL